MTDCCFAVCCGCGSSDLLLLNNDEMGCLSSKEIVMTTIPGQAPPKPMRIVMASRMRLRLRRLRDSNADYELAASLYTRTVMTTTLNHLNKANDVDCDGVLTATELWVNTEPGYKDEGPRIKIDGVPELRIAVGTANAAAESWITIGQIGDQTAMTNDPAKPSQDADCDGVATASDCDDNNPNLRDSDADWDLQWSI